MRARAAITGRSVFYWHLSDQMTCWRKISGCGLPPCACLQYHSCCIQCWRDMAHVWCLYHLHYGVFRRLRRHLVIFLKQQPSFFPMLIKEGGISAKPQHLTCPSVLPLTCFSPVFSPLLCCPSAFFFFARAPADQTCICPCSLLFCLHFYIPLFLSALSLRRSLCQ